MSVLSQPLKLNAFFRLFAALFTWRFKQTPPTLQYIDIHYTTTVVNCLINAWSLPAHRPAYRNKLFAADDNERGSHQSTVRSSFGAFFIEPDLFDNNVPLDNTASIYLINLLCKLGLGLGLDLELHYFRIFREE